MNTVCKEQKTKIMKKSNLDGGTSVGFTNVEVFEVKKHCEHGYDVLKRVNDISIFGKTYRQVNCEICGKYRYKINLTKYHPDLLKEIILIR